MYLISAILGFIFISAIVGFVVYYFTAGRDENSEWRTKEYSILQKILLSLNVIVTIASIYMTLYGFIDNANSNFAPIGIALWAITGIISAYVCSPLRISVPEIQSQLGCGQFLFYPVFAVGIPILIVLTMLISWVFALIAIFRNSKIWFKIIAGIIIFSIAITPFAIMGYRLLEDEKDYKVQQSLKEEILNKIDSAIDSGATQKIVFTEEETAYVKDVLNTYSAFKVEGVNEIIAEKFCEINNQKDADGFLVFMEFLMNNRVSITDDIYFEGGSLRFFMDTIIEKSQNQYFDPKLYRNCYDFDFGKVSIDEIITFMTLPNENGMSDTYIIMDSYYDNRYSADDFALVIDETVMTVREYKQKVR